MLFLPNLIFPCEVIWGSFVPAGTLQSMGVSGNPYLKLSTAQTKGLTHLKVDMFHTLGRHYFVQFSSLVYKGMQQK